MALVITQAGLDKATQADIQGISLKITEVGVGLNGYVPNNSQTKLQNEILRLALQGGKQISPNQIHMTALFDGETEIIGREVGFYLEDGTLFAVDSDPNIIIMYKSASKGSRALEGFDLILDSVPPNSITVDVTGDLGINFDRQFQKIDEKLSLLSAEQYPMGAPIPWPADIAPDNYVIMKGQSFDTEAYTELAVLYPNGVIPDMRGLAIVGKGDGEIMLGYEAGQVKSHDHTGNVSSTDLGTKITNTESHYHLNGIANEIYDVGMMHFGWHDTPSNALALSGTSYAGQRLAHTSTESHNHSVVVGPHNHGVTINSTGAEKNTIDHRKFNWIVRMA